MNEYFTTSNVILKFASNDNFLCCAKIEAKYNYACNTLLSIDYKLRVCLKDIPIEDRTNCDVLRFFKYSYGFSKEKLLSIGDFMLPESVQKYGIARYIIHCIINLIPEEYRSKSKLSGSLSSQDSLKESSIRRDNLWKDVIGYSKNHPKAIFKPATDQAHGFFSGYLHDPWDSERNGRLQIEKLVEK